MNIETILKIVSLVFTALGLVKDLIVKIEGNKKRKEFLEREAVQDIREWYWEQSLEKQRLLLDVICNG